MSSITGNKFYRYAQKYYKTDKDRLAWAKNKLDILSGKWLDDDDIPLVEDVIDHYIYKIGFTAYLKNKKMPMHYRDYSTGFIC